MRMGKILTDNPEITTSACHCVINNFFSPHQALQASISNDVMQLQFFANVLG